MEDDRDGSSQATSLEVGAGAPQASVASKESRHSCLPHIPPPSRMPILRTVIGRSAQGAAEGLSPEAALHARRNFRLGVVNGIMFTLVEALIAPTLVLAYFISGLGASNVLVGLLPAILSGGWFLPQILVATRVQGLPRVMHWYRRVGILRTFCLVLLTISTVALADEPTLLLAVFFLFFTIYAFSAGVTGIPWLEMVGKIVPPRRRGTFFGLRSFWGGLLALAAAGPIGAILSENLWGLTYPYNFAFLFGITTIIVAVGVLAWSSIREPAATSVAPAISVRALLKRGASVLRQDRDYRSFMIARILISLATIADPFYVVYAKQALGAPAVTVGLYLGALAAASLLSNFLWSPLADRASNRLVMSLTVVAFAAVPFSALLLSFLKDVVDNGLLFTLFALVFILSGLAVGAARIVNNNMLLTIAPASERATYIGFLNLVLGIVIFVPVLGGVLVDFLGFTILFVLSLALAAVGLAASLQMSAKRPTNQF
ncbi:MAG: MFS transporter [Chloroflexia bacterium]